MKTMIALCIIALSGCGVGVETPPPKLICADLNHGCVGYDTTAQVACYVAPKDLVGREVHCEPSNIEGRGIWVSTFNPCLCPNGTF